MKNLPWRLAFAFAFASVICFGILTPFPTLGFAQVPSARPLQSTKVLSNDSLSKEDSYSAKKIAKYSIQPNKESIGQYLDNLIPSSSVVQRAKTLIDQLGSHQFQERESATTQLILLPGLPASVLQKAIDGPDPEKSYRAKQIRDGREKVSSELQTAVFRVITEKNIQGLTEKLLAAYDEVTSYAARRALSDAISATAAKEDFEILLEAVDHNEPVLKIAAIHSIAKIDPERAKPTLAKLSLTQDDSLKFEISQIYLRMSDRKFLDLSIELMGSKDLAIRGKAYSVLRRSTGAKIDFSIVDKPEKRSAAIEQWREWVAKNRDTAKIEFTPQIPKLGRILIGMYSQGKVVEIDMTGKVLWEAKLANAFACQGLPNGHRVVAQYSKGIVVEYDELGEVHKTFKNLSTSISGVCRLDNGNTLLAAGQSGNEIQEIDPEGKTVWRKSLEGTPCHALMLESGLMLVSLHGRKEVIEVDKDFKVHWEMEVDGKPYSATRLINGNTMVAYAEGGIAIYDPAAKQIRKYPTGKNTYYAQEMNDGNIIYGDEKGVHIIDPAGREVWKDASYTGYVYINYY